MLETTERYTERYTEEQIVELDNFISDIKQMCHPYVDRDHILNALLSGNEWAMHDLLDCDKVPEEIGLKGLPFLVYLESKGYNHVQYDYVRSEGSQVDDDWGVFSLNGTKWFGNWTYESYNGDDCSGLYDRIRVVEGKMKRVITYVPVED